MPVKTSGMQRNAMKVFLTSAYNYISRTHIPTQWLQSNSISDTCTCIDNPEDADLILFVEGHPSSDPYFRRVLRHPVYKKYKHKCVLYHDADFSITPLPTISPSIELWQYNPKHKRTTHYLARSHDTIDNATISYNDNRDYLYSFMGSKTHAVRGEILSMTHPPDAFIEDTTGINGWELDSTERLKYERRYLEVMNKSYFILCPRGIGPCSYRLFESMQVGRVPVIISDSWVPLPNINWDEVSVTIKQSDINNIPALLGARKKDAIEMGRKARQCWEAHFSPEISLEQIATSAITLIKPPYSYGDFLTEHLQFLKHPHHLKNYLRYRKNLLAKKFRR